ncbi:arylsulfatase [Pandoraea terrae]|uniref:Arylsulfatase n=1 Tax=Pandoraea terrae TaxID=1537710 RepID=A0A5E4Z286_9BURK|nr:sulfatase-like hydrolase/transferase [Pandoraea terrae]VVE55249.1 arylsulfatase [Pandoraea terrae]
MRHQERIRILALCTAAFVLGSFFAPQVAAALGPCEQIADACRQAGFVRGGAKGGTGLQVDCVRPLIQGTAQPNRAGKPLPRVDPSLVAACKAKHPDFGQLPTQPSQPSGQLSRASPPPPVAVVQGAPAQSAASQRPNIVFILTDDLSWNLVQYMPHVLKMQREGATFTNYYVTDSLCCPSRSSIFTGRYPHNTGIYRNVGEDGGYLGFNKRGHEQATFATALQVAGYRTAMLGKYLNGYLPAVHPPAPGWTFWAVAGNGYPGFNYDLNQDGRIVHYGNKPKDYMTDVLSDLAVRFIQQSAGTPFMIEIATFAPHAPYTPAPRDADALPGLRAPRTPAFDAAPDAKAAQWLKAHRSLSDADIAGMATSASIDGRSLAPLVHGQKVSDWGTVALVEQRGPVRNLVDPDLPGIRSGNPTTYEAMRGLASLYVEYANGDREYHDRTTDPDELRNTFSLLSDDEKATLHGTLEEVQRCQGTQSCTGARRPTRSPQRVK